MISLSNCTLSTYLYEHDKTDLRNSLKAVFGLKKSVATRVDILKNVSLEVSSGSKVWLSGRNGAGKTSFLRLLAGIYSPTTGTIVTPERVNCLLDVTLGMNLDCTGIQNIYLLCATRNLPFNYIEKHIDWIKEFSELGNQIETPLRTYSTGMKMRLAAAVALLEPFDMFLLDEFFGALDKEFSDKAFARLQSVMSAESVMFFATHSEDLARTVCTHELHFEKGNVAYFRELT